MSDLLLIARILMWAAFAAIAAMMGTAITAAIIILSGVYLLDLVT